MSWGNKLMVTFIVFATMMSYMVYRCFGTNFELVEKEYYKSELKYQDVIDGTANAAKLGTSVSLVQSGQTILLTLPGEVKGAPVSGTILFYCAYDSKKDKTVPIVVDSNGMQQLAGVIKPGSYIVKLGWNKNGKNYYAEKNLTVR